MTRRSINLIEFWLRLCFYSVPPLAFGCGLMFILALAMMHLFRAVIRAVCSTSRAKFNIAIVGADEIASAVAHRLSANPLMPCQVACFIALPGQVPKVSGPPVVEWEKLEDAVRTFECTELLLALPVTRFSEAKNFLEQLHRLSIPTRIVLHIDSVPISAEHVFDFYGVPLIDVRTHP